MLYESIIDLFLTHLMIITRIWGLELRRLWFKVMNCPGKTQTKNFGNFWVGTGKYTQRVDRVGSTRMFNKLSPSILNKHHCSIIELSWWWCSSGGCWKWGYWRIQRSHRTPEMWWGWPWKCTQFDELLFYFAKFIFNLAHGL